MNYNFGTGDLKNWIVEENIYKSEFLGKTESTFLLGNGYLGIRSANEETQKNTVRNTFISGTFNQADENEVTELPNIADIYELNFKVNGQFLVINNQTVTNYSKRLNLKNGEMTREMTITNGDLVVELKSSRFVSLSDNHITASKVYFTANQAVELEFFSFINGQCSNSGAQHFYDGKKMLVDGKYLQYDATTYQSKISIATHLTQEFNKEIDSLIVMDRRKVGMRYRTSLTAGEQLEMTKFGSFATSIDKNIEDDYLAFGLERIKNAVAAGYDKLLEDSANKWNSYWTENDITIEGDDFTQLSVRFAQYQLRVNCPVHDERMNIGAKGLSGEGYKGHTFWDTELFMLPYFVFTQPEVARSLIKYRFLGLEGARKKAIENGYNGAMYPWEAAWPSDGEVTPVEGAADVVTGKSTKIWSGFIEQHITADVIYGLWLYYKVTGDQQFMNDYGYEMIFDTANYWASRVEKEEKGYVINNVIGPDEYKEHVDNNAFTNYMAKWNLDLALEYLQAIDPELVDKLKDKNAIDPEKLQDVSENIYLQKPNENDVLPQDDTYLSLDTIDLTKYKNADTVGTLFEDYPLSAVNKLQVSKQADVMILFLLMEGLFNKDVKIASWNYYEPKTLHDSSLSLSTHVVLAQDLNKTDISEQLFDKALKIDIGPNMKTSDHGIHTASLGGIWQGVVYGFGGVRIVNEQLRIEPRLHSKWNKLTFPIVYQGNKLIITITSDQFTVENTGSSSITFNSNNQQYQVKPNSQFKLDIN